MAGIMATRWIRMSETLRVNLYLGATSKQEHSTSGDYMERYYRLAP